ncbi:hypothetical protein REPUB_Repub01dG0025100 [Reevesia pubescens]
MDDYAIVPNTLAFNLVLKAMNQAKETEPAQKLLERMLQGGMESLPDDESYDLFIGMLFETQQIEAALKYIDMALKSGYKLSMRVFPACVGCCVNQGRLNILVTVIERCKVGPIVPTCWMRPGQILRCSLCQKKSPSPESFLGKIYAHASLGNLQKAFAMLHEFDAAHGNSINESEDLVLPFTSLYPLAVACSKKGFETLDTIQVYFMLEISTVTIGVHQAHRLQGPMNQKENMILVHEELTKVVWISLHSKGSKLKLFELTIMTDACCSRFKGVSCLSSSSLTEPGALWLWERIRAGQESQVEYATLQKVVSLLVLDQNQLTRPVMLADMALYSISSFIRMQELEQPSERVKKEGNSQNFTTYPLQL